MRVHEDLCLRCLIFSLSDIDLLFALFYCLFDLSCGECNIISLYVLCFSVTGSVCFVYFVSDSVYELFGETIRNVLRCGCLFGVVRGGLMDRPCMVLQRVYVL